MSLTIVNLKFILDLNIELAPHLGSLWLVTCDLGLISELHCVTQDNHQNFNPSILFKALWLAFMKQNHGVVLGLVGLIDVKGRCGSTYMAMRLASNISSKRAKKLKYIMHFLPFVKLMLDSLMAIYLGWATSMPFASINPTNPRTNPWIKKKIRIGGIEKTQIFWVSHFRFFFPWKSVKVIEILIFTLVSRKYILNPIKLLKRIPILFIYLAKKSMATSQSPLFSTSDLTPQQLHQLYLCSLLLGRKKWVNCMYFV